VATVTATRQNSAPEVLRTGTLRARREVRILVQEEGRLVDLPFHEGDRVERGTTLLRLDDRLLRAQWKRLQAERRQAELDLQRLSRLEGSGVVTEEALARARTAVDVARADEELLHIRLDHTVVEAPFAGVVTTRLAEPGDVIQRFDHVLTLVDLGSLVTEITVSELLLPALAVGDPAQVRIDALGRASHSGSILRIHPSVDAATRRGVVEVALEPPPSGARPGQLCRVTLRGHAESRLTVPFAALRSDGENAHLFVVDEEERARRRPVTTGLHLGDRVEILSGLEAGERVVVKGFLGLDDGTAVHAVSQAQ